MIGRKLFGALVVSALFVCANAFAQVPSIKPPTELELAQQQLMQLHKLYDEQERARVMDMQNANTAVKKWMDYYSSCKPVDKWLCDE